MLRNSRVQAVFWLDFLLLILMCALESVSFTGLILHEWIALGIVGLILIHLLLSWTWVSASTRRLTTAGAARTRVNFALNLTLFISVVTLLFSGFLISEVAVPTLGIQTLAGDIRWRSLHNTASTLTLIFVGLHLAINWDWSVASARKCLGMGPSSLR
jgi:cytochrome b561